MPNTGLFNITRADAAPAEGQQGTRSVTRVRAQCLTCLTDLRATLGAGLEAVEGGVVIACSGCGARQGVSNNLFAEVTRGV